MSAKLSCIAIDDELVALKIIVSLIEKTPILELKGTFQDSVEGMNKVVSEQPDILFLDIQMPEISGMDIIKSLDKKPEIILVTSNKSYATDAFDFNVTDYLLKPIPSYSRFLQAVERAKQNLNRTPAISAEQNNDSIFLRIDSLLKKINYSDILFIEAFGDYIKVHTNERVYTIYNKLKSIELELPKSDFMRVHRSYIVNIDKIDNIDQNSIQINDKLVPVSTRHKATLLETINTL